MSSTKPGTVFVTGASSGFGAAVARRFAADGARVVAAARRADRVKDLAAELGPQVLPLALDVRDRPAVAAAVAALPEEFKAIDVLVNNAGLALGLNPAQDADLDDWDQMIDTNCKGLVYCTRAILPGMVARGRGHVINLGSVAGTYPYPGGNVYGGTKAFVHQFSLNLRSDLHGTGVRVTCVEPGMADTEFSLVRFSGDQAKADNVYAGMQPMTADDIAESIHWAATMPQHVNVNTIELMATAQSFAPFQVARDAVIAAAGRPSRPLPRPSAYRSWGRKRNTSSRRLASDGSVSRTVSTSDMSAFVTATPADGPRSAPHHAERVDQHGPAHPGRRAGRLLVRVGHLPDGGDPHGVLDRPGAQQRDPVLFLEQPRLPGGADRDERGAAGRQGARQLGEPDVVADLQARPARPPSVVTTTASPGATRSDSRWREGVEQVQLPVGGDAGAVAVDHHGGVVDPPVGRGLEHAGHQRRRPSPSPPRPGPSRTARRAAPPPPAGRSRSGPCVASGNTARSAPLTAASRSASRTRRRLTPGSELPGSWHRAIRMPPR